MVKVSQWSLGETYFLFSDLLLNDRQGLAHCEVLLDFRGHRVVPHINFFIHFPPFLDLSDLFASCFGFYAVNANEMK